MASMYADDSFYYPIIRWGQNNVDDWWQPLTAHQFTEYGFATTKIGDRATFWLNDEAYDVVVIGMLDKVGYQALAKVYGELPLRGWQIDHLIRMKSI